MHNHSDKRILVVGGAMSYGAPLEGMGILNCNHELFLNEPDAFRLVVFTGGEDVTPELYGHTSPKGMCQNSPTRDTEEKIVFDRAKEKGIKMTGICRGAQFLNVMAGGKLIHHLDRHTGGMHEVHCSRWHANFVVNSLHHQMCLPGSQGYVVAWAAPKQSKIYIGDKDESVTYPGPEVEALILPDIKAIVVQWHPEMLPANHAAYLWYRTAVTDLLTMNFLEFVKTYRGVEKNGGVSAV